MQCQRLVQVRTERVRHQLVLLRGIRPVPDPLPIEQHRGRLRADAENGYVLQFRRNVEPARPGDRDLVFRCREGKGPTRAGRAADSIVDIGRSMSDALSSLRHEKRVRALACLLDCVCRRGVQENGCTVADVHVDVPQRRGEGARRSRCGVYDIMGIPITPDDASSAGEDAYVGGDDRQNTREDKETADWPDTEVTLGSSTGVTRMSPPTRNCELMLKSSDSLGNS